MYNIYNLYLLRSKSCGKFWSWQQTEQMNRQKGRKKFPLLLPWLFPFRHNYILLIDITHYMYIYLQLLEDDFLLHAMLFTFFRLAISILQCQKIKCFHSRRGTDTIHCEQGNNTTFPSANILSKSMVQGLLFSDALFRIVASCQRLKLWNTSYWLYLATILYHHKTSLRSKGVSWPWGHISKVTAHKSVSGSWLLTFMIDF